MSVVQKYYSVTETCFLLSVSADTVLRRIKSGDFGGGERFDPNQQCLFDDGAPMQVELWQVLELRRKGAARRRLASQGKLAPFEQRVLPALQAAMATNVKSYRAAVEARVVPLATIPVEAAVLTDKRQLAVGLPTSISATIQARQLQFSEAEMNAPIVGIVQSSDSASPVSAPNPQQMLGIYEMDASLDAVPPQKAGVHQPADGGKDGRSPAPVNLRARLHKGGIIRMESELPGKQR